MEEVELLSDVKETDAVERWYKVLQTLIYGLMSISYLMSSVMAMQYFQRSTTLPMASHSKEVEGWVLWEQSRINNFASRKELVQAEVLGAGMHLKQWVATEELW